jgi:hypothetical protein
MEYYAWEVAACRAALEVFAEINGVSLEPVEEITLRISIHKHAAMDLLALAERLPPPDGLIREHPILSLARYAQRVDEIGAEMERLEIDDVEALLGRRFESLAQADVELETFVHSRGEDYEVPLLRLFYRRVMRRRQLLRGYPAPIVERGLGYTR